MKRSILLVLVATLLTTAASSQGPFRAGMAIDNTWNASGHCRPTNVRFTGRINGTGQGTVVYQWVRSDGANTPEKTLHFTKPGPLPVSFTWSVTGNTLGWVALRMISPSRVETKHVVFRIGGCK